MQISSLVETLMQQLGGGALSQISKQLGTDEPSAGNATGAVLATLMGALAKNSSSADGAQALHRALEKDHDGSLLDADGDGDVDLGDIAKRGAGILGKQQATGRGCS